MLKRLESRVALELGLAFVVAFAAVFAVNSPSYHYVSAALAAYLGLLVGIPWISAKLRGEEFASEHGLSETITLSWKYFAASLLLPIALIPMLWQAAVAPTVMFAVVVAPPCEEVFFRGYLAGRLRGLGFLPASLASAALFAVFHLGAQQFRDPGSVAILMLFGLIYAPLFLLTRSVYVTTSIHAGWNLFAYLAAAAPASLLGYVSFVALGLIVLADLCLAILEVIQARREAAFNPWMFSGPHRRAHPSAFRLLLRGLPIGGRGIHLVKIK